MIQDTLKANPGMRETYRAYGGKMAVEYRIEELRKRREKSLADNVLGKKNQLECDEKLVQLRSRLQEVELEIQRCRENENRLRAQAGMAPIVWDVK